MFQPAMNISIEILFQINQYLCDVLFSYYYLDSEILSDINGPASIPSINIVSLWKIPSEPPSILTTWLFSWLALSLPLVENTWVVFFVEK